MSADLIAQGLALSARSVALAARQSLPVYNRPGLAAWHAALANRTSAPAKVLWVGDSITEGVNAASYGTRWVDRALARLRQDHPVAGVAGGFGYLPGIFGGGTAAGTQKAQGQPYTSLTGGTPALDTSFGLGGRSIKFNGAVGDGAVYNLTCSSFQVHWIKGTNLGTLDILVDGVAVASFSTAGALGPQVWTSAALTPGLHAITLKRSAGGDVYVAGLVGFNGDEAAGVQGYEAGHFGWTAGQYAAAQSWTWAAVGQVAPQLAVVTLGTNDYQAQVAPETYKANLASIAAQLRAASPGLSIALLAYSRRGDSAPQPTGWDQYVRALYDLADADSGGINGGSGVAVIDLSVRLPNAATTGAPVDPLGLYNGDRVHFEAKGHAVIGDMVGRALAQ